MSTAVSNATTIIAEGATGHVVPQRDPLLYSAAIRSAMAMPRAEVGVRSTSPVGNYGKFNIRADLLRAWPSLSHTLRHKAAGWRLPAGK